MKPVLSISAAVLLAISMTACGDSDTQNKPSENAQTNTASENSQAMPEDNGSSEDQGEQDMNGDESSAMASSQSSSEDMPRAAIAVLHGTQGNDDATATIRFTPKDGGVAYTTTATGLAPGKHGYHIHLYGDCSSGDGKSAGTHFNLKGSSENPPKDIDRITGDLGDLEVGDDGSANADGMIDGASLTGAKSIIGRGVIIHAKANDPSQPPIGAAGSRQACGVIGIAKP
ncbi:superoxide dismutase family protein [Salinisphaera aquimarina]|uniref:Superoxide dismutase family protein n=1 Tax=Salinisphaera aquimarina TaxID=2094031 RepID=A0ABV7EPQ0_9GAMM